MSWLSDLWSGDDKSSAPKWYTDQAKNIVNRGNQAANLYPPIYAGAVMANPSGQTQAGWNQADQFARAAGMATGLPPGVSPSMSFNQRMDPYKVEGGYSSNPLLKAGMGATSEAYPGIYDSLWRRKVTDHNLPYRLLVNPVVVPAAPVASAAPVTVAKAAAPVEPLATALKGRTLLTVAIA